MASEMYLKNKSKMLNMNWSIKVKVGSAEDLKGKDEKVGLEQVTCRIMHVF